MYNRKLKKNKKRRRRKSIQDKKSGKNIFLLLCVFGYFHKVDGKDTKGTKKKRSKFDFDY